jgi:hypothetical protein
MKALDGMTTKTIGICAAKMAALLAAMLASANLCAQSPSTPAAKPAEQRAPEGGPLAPLAWLEGCWGGSVSQREYREHWMPLRGNLLIGTSQTVADGKVREFEYLRIEAREDAVYYVAAPSGKKEEAFRLAEQTVDRKDGRNDEIFVFVNPALEFPQKITYRRASEGWLYAVVEGKVNGADRQVTYPMRRIGCESGEFIRR